MGHEWPQNIGETVHAGDVAFLPHPLVVPGGIEENAAGSRLHLGSPCMQNLLAQLFRASSTSAVAWCRLVETRGSTPQKAGALMLVFENGAQAGTLGGGCVEAEVKRRALAALAAGRSEIAEFQLNSDYGWDDGLICGGRMHILIEPVPRQSPPNYFAALRDLTERGAAFTEAVVYDPEASALPAPTSYLLDADARLLATLPPTNASQALPPEIAQALRSVAERPQPYAAHGVSYLPFLERCRLVIVGGGHVGEAVAKLAAQLEFDIWVVDDRAEYANAQRFPQAERCVVGSFAEVLPQLEITPSTYCLIVTRGHNHDQEALWHVVNRGARYVGMIGSRRKIKLIFDNLAAEGISRELLDRVHAPVGLDIGSQTVPEIAVSICAQLIAHRSGRCGGQPEK